MIKLCKRLFERFKTSTGKQWLAYWCLGSAAQFFYFGQFHMALMQLVFSAVWFVSWFLSRKTEALTAAADPVQPRPQTPQGKMRKFRRW